MEELFTLSRFHAAPQHGELAVQAEQSFLGISGCTDCGGAGVVVLYVLDLYS